MSICFYCLGTQQLLKLKCKHHICQGCLVENLQNLSKGTAMVCYGSNKDVTGSDETNCGETISMIWVNQANIDVDKIEAFESALNDIHYKIKRATTCNKCKNHYIRRNTSDVRLSCDVCKFDFCFICGNQWKNGERICGNGCSNEDPLITALTTRSSVTAKINLSNQEIVVPLARLCVNCGHYCERQASSDGKLDRCKHTHCPRCNAVFCHACLSLYNTNTGKWPFKCSGTEATGTTHGAYVKCSLPVAPTQTKEDLHEIENRLLFQ